MWPFSSRARRRRGAWDLSTSILQFSAHDRWTIGDSCMGTQIWGSTGSGKSTGSLAAICRAFLRAGYGGLFLTAKPDDAATYTRYCAEFGRSDDLLIFGVGRPLRYNALDAELHRRDAGAGLTENVVALLTTLLEVSERNSSEGGHDDSGGYWRRTNRQLLRNAVDLLVMAKNRLSVPELYKLVISAPNSMQQVRSDDWRQQSFCYQCLKEADAKEGSRRQRDDLELVSAFFLSEWATLSDRTRSVVLSTFTSMLDVLNRGVVRELLSGTTNVTPEMAQDGKIILIDLPPKLFGEIGVFVQVLWKFCFQRAMERRNIADNPRPVFIVADESHLLAVSSDQVFMTTARSTRTAVVYATQSISNYLAALGGDRAEAQTHSMLGNFCSQIFHQQADIRTNEYAAQLIGRTRQFLSNANTNYQPDYGMGGLFGSNLGGMSAGVSEVFEYEVQPSVFTTLAKGGPPEWNVGSIVFHGGRRFHDTGRSWLPVMFRQHV